MSIESKQNLYNQDNIEILATAVVDGWDQDAVIHFAIFHLKQAYQANKKCFKKDWDSYIKSYI